MNPQQIMPPLNLPPIEEVIAPPTASVDPQVQPTAAISPVGAAVNTTAAISTNSDNANPGSVNQSSSSPVIADDVDLIEKEWVKKISEIISKTQNTPYEKARQLSILKQDYMQKRYNKTTKLS